MKNLVRFSVFLAALLVSLSGCELYNAINLAWNIDNVIPGVPFTHVVYTVQNMGKDDLTGVNLQVGVDMTGNGVSYPCSAWTPDFSIHEGQTIHGSIDVPIPGVVLPAGWATVLSVDMDNPKG